MDVLFNFNKPGDDIFGDEPLPQAHYHPSAQKQLTDGEKQLKLTAPNERLSKPSQSSKSKPGTNKHASPGERRFLLETNTMLARELPTHDTPSPRDASAKFDESWPISERPSTIESPSDISHVSSKLSSIQLATSSSSVRRGWGSDEISRGVEQWRTSVTKKASPSKESTLAKYIHRFRHSEPKSREERGREKVPASREFWWMSPPPHSSTPTDDSAKQSTSRSLSGIRETSQSHQRFPLRTGGLIPKSNVGKGMNSSSTSQKAKSSSVPSSSSFSSSILDVATAQLQARADRLLEKSESTQLSEPAVSSEGVGASPCSTTTEDSVYIPQILYTQTDTENPPRPDIQTRSNLRPEDDILYQWRVRRRLEQARQCSEAKVDPAVGVHVQLTPAVAQSKDSGNGNSTLEDFRKRLKQHHVLSESRQGITNLHVLPQSDESVRHTGTDPIPQSIATQTNGMLPSVGTNVLPSNGQKVLDAPGVSQSGSAVGSRDVHPEYQLDVPVRDTEDSRKQLFLEMETELDEPVSDSRIGSRKHPIASPHIERTHAPEKGQSLPVAPHWHLACDILPCEQSDPHMHIGNAVKKQGSENCLQREREQNGDCSDMTRSYHHGMKGNVSHQKRGQSVQQRTDGDIVEHHPEILDRHEMGERQQQNRGTTLRQDRIESHPRQRLDFENVDVESPSTPLQRSMKVRGHGKVRSERLQVTSSPVASAIGQVISSRLFTSTPSPASHSPESSAASLPSMQHSPSTQSGSSIPTKDNDSESTTSDGEFEDDELLQVLRRRRAEYEQQLHHLDELIEKAQ